MHVRSASPGPLQITLGRQYLAAFHVKQILPATGPGMAVTPRQFTYP